MPRLQTVYHWFPSIRWYAYTVDGSRVSELPLRSRRSLTQCDDASRGLLYVSPMQDPSWILMHHPPFVLGEAVCSGVSCTYQSMSSDARYSKTSCFTNSRQHRYEWPREPIVLGTGSRTNGYRSTRATAAPPRYDHANHGSETETSHRWFRSWQQPDAT